MATTSIIQPTIAEFAAWLATKDEDEPVGDPGHPDLCPFYNFFREVRGIDTHITFDAITTFQSSPYAELVRVDVDAWVEDAQWKFQYESDIRHEQERLARDGVIRPYITAGQAMNALQRTGEWYAARGTNG